MAERRSTRANTQNAAASSVALVPQSATKSKKRTAAAVPTFDEGPEHKPQDTKMTKRLAAKYKTKATTATQVQALPGSNGDLLSCLPLEILQMILDNIKDSSSLGKLSRTSKTYYELVAPRLHKRVVFLDSYHSRLETLMRASEPYLTEAQKMPLRSHPKYKGQQEPYPSHIDKHAPPRAAAFVRQLIVGDCSIAAIHEVIFERTLVAAFGNWRNLEIVETGLVTGSLGDKIASIQNLRALNITHYVNEHAVLPLTEIQGLQHLAILEMVPEHYGHNFLFSFIISNSRMTLKTLEVRGTPGSTSFVENWETRGLGNRGPLNDEYDFPSLESLILDDTVFEEKDENCLERSINFMKLRELVVRPCYDNNSGLFKRLTRLAATASEVSLRSLFITLTSRMYRAREQDKPLISLKCRFLSSFDTLTSLELHHDPRHRIDATADPVMENKVLQAIIKHRGLKTLRLSHWELASEHDMSYISAKFVLALVQNLLYLEEIEFAPEMEEIEQIGSALSECTDLRTIICYPFRGGEVFPYKPAPGRMILEGILKGFLSNNKESAHNTDFVWEEHFKLNCLSVHYQKWDIRSKFGKTPKGTKKAEKLTSTDGNRHVLFRDVRGLKRPFRTRGGYDPEHKWVDKVERDIQ